MADGATTERGMASEEEILVATATEDDAQLIGDFLVKNFFPNEPITARLKGNLDAELPPIVNYLDVILRQKVTLKATLGEKCVGVLVSEILHKDESKNAPDMFDYLKEGQRGGINEIAVILSKLHEGHDLFTSYNAESIAHLYLLGVDSSFSGRGIGKNLLAKCESNLVQNHGQAKIMFAETTGDISCFLFKRAGFQKVNELFYEDYVDQQGHRPFQHLDMHKSSVLWVKPLSQLS